MKQRRTASLLLAGAGALLAGVLVAPSATTAYPDAKVESVLRPCFGVLTEPDIRDCKRGKSKGDRRGDGGDSSAVHVWCDKNPSGRPIAAALKRVRPGGKIVIHARDRACEESVEITKSVWLEGDSGAARVSGVSLVAPAGRPCIRIAPGVRDVKISGLTIDGSRSGASSCVEAADTDLLLVNVAVRYEGEGSAVDVKRGRLRMGGDFDVRARSVQAAVKSDGALLDIDGGAVRGTVAGLDVTPGPGVNSVRNLRMRGMEDWFDRVESERSTGVVVRGDGEGVVEFRDTAICGYRTGLWAERGSVVGFFGKKICRAEIGIVSDGARMRIQGAEIGATDTGIYADYGVAELYGNRIYGVTRAAVFTDKQAQVWSEGNQVHPYGRKCSELDGGFLRSGLLCKPYDELPSFYLTERQPSAGRFDDDRAYFNVESSWSGGQDQGGYGFKDDWWRSEPGPRRW